MALAETVSLCSTDLAPELCRPFRPFGSLIPGASVPEGGSCTPSCGNGSVPLDPTPLQCRFGQLTPNSFSCRPVRCELLVAPGLFADETNRQVPFDVLKGAKVLWSQSFPMGGVDYPAEEVCKSALGGSGCNTCYSPLQTIEVVMPEIDGLSRVLLAFEARQGRRLAIVFEDLEWSRNRAYRAVDQ